MPDFRDLLSKPVGEPFTSSERRLVLEIEARLCELEEENARLSATNRALSEMSSRDALTGLYSRWYVLEKIDREINRSLRHGSPMSLLMIDIDHFKQVNDAFGHLVGDEVLRAVGQLLKESCRIYDVPGRYGGEEFCVLLPETRIGNTPPVAERIRNRLATCEMRCGDHSFIVTASFGISGLDEIESADLSPSVLIERADRALYLAKSHGRNCIEMWDEGATEH
jgi:diguanylate cyclase (GGDEF)-like protein